MTTTPFRSVHSIDDHLTHLVVLSPALVGSRCDQTPTGTLCGKRSSKESETPTHEVQCRRCLLRTQTFSALPAYLGSL